MKVDQIVNPGSQAGGRDSSLIEVAALAATSAALMAACGGSGADPIPARMFELERAVPNPSLLEVPRHQRIALPVRVPDANEFMDWAEKAFPAFFPGPQGSITSPPYVIRYYAATGIYLGVSGGAIYMLGPVTGGNLTQVGTLAGFAALVFPGYASARTSQRRGGCTIPTAGAVSHPPTPRSQRCAPKASVPG